MSDVPTVCSNPAGCQCEICKLFPAPGPAPDMAAYDIAVARRVRAEVRLRSQRKRHAQREAALRLQLEAALARAKCAEREVERLKLDALHLNPVSTLTERLRRLESVGRVERLAMDIYLVRTGRGSIPIRVVEPEGKGEGEVKA